MIGMASSSIAFPFLTLSGSTVRASSWQISLNGSDWGVVGDYLPDWDASSSIRIRRTISIDPSLAGRDLALTGGVPTLSLGIRLGTGVGRVPRMVFLQDSCEFGPDQWALDVEYEVPGRKLSSVLDILTVITLSHAAENTPPLAPQRRGDRIWQDRARVRLEGEEPRFPIEVANFRQLIGQDIASSSPWYLHWFPGDWSRDFHGAIRLYLNSEGKAFIRRVEDEDPHILQAIMADVMCQVCERYVMDSEADEHFKNLEAGSIGSQAAEWIHKLWPGRDTEFVRSILENKPGTFRASFLALANFGEGSEG